MWRSGDAAILRYVHDGRVSRIVPVTVVGDEERGTQLYVRPGTPTRTRCDENGVPIPRSLPYAERFGRPWALGDGQWSGYHMLMLTPAHAAFSFWAVWDEAWAAQEWYVNLQEPLRRTRFGFDTADNVLDLVVSPDLTTWHWKDEDEVAEAVRVGRFTSGDVEELYRVGRHAVRTLERRQWPFDRVWSSWRPDPAWPAPHLDPAAEVV